MSAPDADPAPIAEEELGRLIRILGMLGSAFEGERAAAALKAAEWVREHATSWELLLAPPAIANPVVSVGVGEPQEPEPPPPPTGRLPTWQLAAAAILQHYVAVLKGSKELEFVQSLLARGWPKLTDRQAEWLRDICGRAGLSW